MLKSRKKGAFKKDVKLLLKRRYNMAELDNTVILLINEQPLPAHCRPHKLHGNYEGKTECHITNDWLLIYDIDEEKREIVFERTGTHADLF